MKITHVAFRDSVYHAGKSSLAEKDCQSPMELHPAGVLVHVKGQPRILVPFSNVKWLTVGEEGVKKP